MTASDGTLDTALARLHARWGSAAVRLGNGGRVDARPSPRVPLEGALAPVLVPADAGQPHPLTPLPPDATSTGFAALDTILGTGGLPRAASVTIRGDASCGKTTLALRAVAEAQAAGSIVAWLDLVRGFDPLEAVARGVDLRWLVVVRPADEVEGFRLGGALLSGRAVDALVVDLPPRIVGAQEPLLRRLAAHARRIGARLIVLEPSGLGRRLNGALAELSGIRLELERGDWIRLGRDVVGQRTRVTVSKNRYAPPGRSAELEIRYAEEGERAPGLMRRLDAAREHAPPARVMPASPLRPLPREDIDRPTHATAAPLLDPSAAPPGARPARPPRRSRDRRRTAVGGAGGPRLQSRGAPPGRAPGAAAWLGP